jgi:hypothetical protein
LIEERLGFSFFYEVKANLSRADLELLSQAGVDSIQPGVESLNSHVLKLMKKGITAASNVNTLRWATYYKINTSWNILYGFPGEALRDYEEQTALIKFLTHLQPPTVVTRLWLERFSPLFNAAMSERRPTESYSYVYPSTVDLSKAAYFFEGELFGTVLDADVDELVEEVNSWRDAWRTADKPSFIFARYGDDVILTDRRVASIVKQTLLKAADAALICAASDRPRSFTSLCAQFSSDYASDRILQAIENLCRDGVLMRDGESVLTLALPDENR